MYTILVDGEAKYACNDLNRFAVALQKFANIQNVKVENREAARPGTSV
jgi:hypothetical protein